jgi:hypothetical protein
MFDILSEQYIHERKRYEYLHTRATSNLAIAGALSTALGLFVGKELLSQTDSSLVFIIYILGMLSLMASIISVIFATRIQGYREVVDIKSIIIESEQEEYEKEDLYSIMLANLADCSEHNMKLMDSGFDWLTRCSISLCIAILLITSGVIIHSISNFIAG